VGRIHRILRLVSSGSSRHPVKRVLATPKTIKRFWLATCAARNFLLKTWRGVRLDLSEERLSGNGMMSLRARILLCVVPAMILPSIGAMLYFVICSGTALGRTFYMATKAFTLVWPIVAILAVERQAITLKLTNAARHFRAIPLGLLSGAVIAGFMIAMYKWSPMGDYVRANREAVRGKIAELGLLDPPVYVAFGVFIALLHSLLEEYFWRWYVFGRLSQVIALPSAYVLASLAFAGHHYVVLATYSPAWMVALFGTCVGIGGGFWCWLFRRQQSLVGAWMSHLLVDVAILCVGYELVFL
jgi:hypothetical protein